MKNYYIHILYVLIILGLTLSGCKFTSQSPENPVQTGGISTLSGTVVNFSTGDPVSNASVNIYGGTSAQGTTTDNSGNYTIDVNLDQDADLIIIASHSGYLNDTTTVFAQIGSTADVPF